MKIGNRDRVKQMNDSRNQHICLLKQKEVVMIIK
jgi:hypothetical protein